MHLERQTNSNLFYGTSMEVLNRQITKGKPFFYVFSYKSAKYHEVHVFSKTYTERRCVDVSRRLCHRRQPQKVVFGRHQKLLTVTFFFSALYWKFSFHIIPCFCQVFCEVQSVATMRICFV